MAFFLALRLVFFLAFFLTLRLAFFLALRLVFFLAFFFTLRLAFFLALRLVFFFAFFLVFFLALRLVFFLAFFLVFRFATFFFAFFFVLRLATFFFALRLATFLLGAFFLVTFRFLATFRFEAFLRDFFLVAILFLRVGYPALSIYNKGKKSSKLSDAVNILQCTQNGRFSGEKANNFSVALLDSEITMTCRNL